QNFHGRFKELFAQVNTVKSRLQFYEASKKEAVTDGPPPTGTVCIIFTDVQDSTRLWESNISAMAESIKIHNDIIRKLLRQYEGNEVKTEGDAFMCAFSDTRKAVEFSLQVQVQLLSGNWPEEILMMDSARIEKDADGTVLFRGLRVRMGIHVGEPIIEQDPVTGRVDYFGPVVNRAARVENQAQGGQIVISSAVWAEIEDSI